jgi:hypothetical protein
MKCPKEEKYSNDGTLNVENDSSEPQTIKNMERISKH